MTGVRDVRRDGSTVRLTVEGSMAALLAAAAPHRIGQLVTHEPDLEEIFLGYYHTQE